MKTVVILGGSFAGVGTAHRLLKQTAKTSDVKIILVSPNTHLYWNIAATRAIVPGQLKDDKIFQPITPGFKQYGARFEFVLGTAEGLNVNSQKVEVAGASGTLTLDYDILILATGSRAKEGVPFKGVGSYEATRDALHKFGERVNAAKTITVVGGGATGVEVAGELAFDFGTSKKIILIASGATVLEGTPASVSKTATKQLKSLQVEIKTGTKVSGTATMPDGRTEVTLFDGTKLTTDLYIPTMGLIPNSAYVPQHLLNQNGFVVVDQYLRVKGAENVWAVGDISAVQRAQYVNVEKQSPHVAKNIILGLQNKPLVTFKVDDKDMLAVPVGKKSGTGHMGSMKLPSFMVVMVKGKTLFTEKMAPTVSGAAY
ncbi:hypothetical protein PVAG01_00114 [Phlyctema vagabunda]|uniref:FAD/NAD(P)-binding domain-containing protein n=1 Tax=Phlyctema vagabunda TaxID=108571 RepID=A0ABR4PTP9_9HELO